MIQYFFDTKWNQCHFEKISNFISFVYYQIDTDFLPIALIFDCQIKYRRLFFLPMFSRSQNVTISLHILPILDHWKARLWMLNWLKSETMNVELVKKAILGMLNWLKSNIRNVELVQNQYYDCWIGLKLLKTSISILCLFVNMKQLQNEKSRISTDLIRNLKIKISLSVLNRYCFKNSHFHIISYLIISISNGILFSCTNFSISPMPDCWPMLC
jgi:hypothetical protein